MIALDKYNVNPFIRSSRSPSYRKNIGNVYPALCIRECRETIRIYDGVLYINEEKKAELENYTIGGMYKILKENGISVQVFPGMKHINAISMINFCNVDIVDIELTHSPIDLPLYKSPYLIETSIDNYLGNVEISFDKYSVASVPTAELKGQKVYVESSDIGKSLYATHTAVNFIMLMSDQNIIRDINRVSKIPNVKQQLVSWNRKVKGDDNADIII